MTSKMTRLALAVALSSLAGVAGAQTFTASATVQNAVTITEDTELSFGTLFATKTAKGAADAESQKLTLAANTGLITPVAPATAAKAGPSIQSLGGQAAGAYRAPGLPSNSTVIVAILDNQDDQEDFKNDTTVADAACAYDTPEAARADKKIVMAHEIGDPSIGFFCIDMFTSDRTGLLNVGAAPAAGYSLGFGVTELTFKLGATLIAQAPTAAIADGRTYEEGNYSASFDMEVRFP